LDRSPDIRVLRALVTGGTGFIITDFSYHGVTDVLSGIAFAERESNPLDSIEKFPSATSDFLLSQIYPGATAKLPRELQVRSRKVLEGFGGC